MVVALFLQSQLQEAAEKDGCGRIGSLEPWPWLFRALKAAAMGGQERSWNSEELLDKGWQGVGIPGARSPGSWRWCVWSQALGGDRAWGTATSGKDTELRTQGQQGTEGETVADYWPAGQLQMNKGLGSRQGRKAGSRRSRTFCQRPS